MLKRFETGSNSCDVLISKRMNQDKSGYNIKQILILNYIILYTDSS